MESGAILDSQLTSSSFEDWDRTAAKARLNAAKAWVRHRTDTKLWVKVDFLGRIKLTGVLTQGRGIYGHWVASFTMSTSNNDVDYPVYKEFGQIKLFQANYDDKTVVEQRLTRTVVARFVLLTSKTWNALSSMRIEFQGEYIVTNWFDPVPLGMQSRMIVDSQITASSSKFFQSGASNGRLNLTTVDNVRYGGWIAADYDSDPWLEVDFIANITLTSISTQGLDGGQSWVRSYTVASGFRRDSLEEYKIKDEIKVFNATSGLTVKQYLYPFIIARHIRIKPKICAGSCSLRAEFYGRYEGALNPVYLGMENGTILDSQITASSSANWNHRAARARLNMKPTSKGEVWVRHSSDHKPWVKVDFLGPTKLSRILTQGRGVSDNWVSAFTMWTSNNDVDYQIYEEFGQIKVFEANYDRNTIVEQRLTRTVVTRFVRLNVERWGGVPSMRIEFQGEYIVTDWYDPIPLGMQNGMILDSQISASSSKSTKAGPWNARLNLTTVENVNFGGWIVAEHDKDPWLQVDFIANVTVTAIATQGLDGGQQKTLNYTVSFGFDRDFLQNYTVKGQIKIFPAVHADGSLMKQDLWPHITARFVRIKPKHCIELCALRIEVYGRYEDSMHSHALGMESRKIIDSQVSASSMHGFAYRPQLARLNIQEIPGVLAGGWCPRDHDTNPWFQVDFLVPTMVDRVDTQCRSYRHYCCKTFTLSTSSNGEKFNMYKEFNHVKIFEGNYIRAARSVEQRLTHPIFTRFIRINFKEKSGLGYGLRLELIGNYKDTNWFNPVPLGMKSRLILDTQIIASSSNGTIAGAWNGRLDLTTIDNVRYGGWIAADYDNDPWLEVDFISNVTVTAISIQGLEGGQHWVKSFTVNFGYKKDIQESYKVNGNPKVFSANYDSNSTTWLDIFPHINARFIRVKPKDCHGFCALRVELHGRYEDCNDPQRLGIADHKILDSQMTASSYESHETWASLGKLYTVRIKGKNLGGWVMHNYDVNPWIQVDFLKNTKITHMLSRGRQDYSQWVTAFTISYSNDEISFSDYMENGLKRVFIANFDRVTTVKQHLVNEIFARYVRVYCTKNHDKAAIRIEFLGCSCDSTWRHSDALGMENLSILDSQLTASSSQYYNATASNARLNLKTNPSSYGAWIAAENDNNPWLQVDFITNVTITAIATQGLDGGQHWVKEYSIGFGPDNILFTNYEEDGKTKIFPANFDSRSTKRHDIYPNILARFIRVTATACAGYCALRVEFYGRYEACEIKSYLGMANHEILDSQITASSVYGNDITAHRASLARINLTQVIGTHYGAWAQHADQNPWLQVDFLVKRIICAVLTQGRQDSFQFVKTYIMHESSDGLNFVEYKDRGAGKVFQANFDMSTIVRQRLQRVIFARFVRIYPKTWHIHLSMRIEFEGCRKAVDDWFNPVALGIENGLISALQLTASSAQNSLSGAKNSRLNLNTNPERHGGWIAAENDVNPWLQVDFFTNATVTRIDTQGSASSKSRVTSYAASLSTDGLSFQEYKQYDKVKVFLANYEENSTVRQDVVPSFTTRVLRIIPKSWIGNCSLRIEVYGRYEGCREVKDLGVENNKILDSQFSASSEARYGLRPAAARLNLDALPLNVREGILKSWLNKTRPSEIAKRLKLPLRTVLNITERFIDNDGNVQPTEPGQRFRTARTDDVVALILKRMLKRLNQVFSANKDRHSVVTQFMFPPLYGRFVRVEPKTWNGKCSIRLEFLGCHEDCSSPEPLGMENKTIRDDQIDASSRCIHPNVLGMENGQIRDHQISSSSEKSASVSASKARLNKHGAWKPSPDDGNKYLRVDFLYRTIVVSVTTQGFVDAWASDYSLAYKENFTSFKTYNEDRVKRVGY
ncbi:uncharacterized protein LOC114535069 [Dendronephthya gigantea]|uniref:uncharacterized protein LOC114535069 n=1 Tax=Dendronephthya gigantea TaxID=151771 RepID=UPI001069AB06|nr:uncharacterized protein LOC114535069 [Dendronephthya gigantea]